jgi:ribose 5-phosphate isomerase B
MTEKRKIIIGADHAGFILKEKVKMFLIEKGWIVGDVSPILKEGDDYPDIAERVGKKVVKEKATGILICGSGTGMCIAANKIKGARAVAAYSRYTAKMARKDNNANILCLRGRRYCFWTTKGIVKKFLKTEFSGEARHKRRIKKIEALR